MVLHMMLFYRLPYRWSSDGRRFGFGFSGENSDKPSDEHGEAGTRGDGRDFVRLENEVLNYPG